MKPAPIIETVRSKGSGSLKIEVRAYSDGRFGFDWKQADGERKKIRAERKDDAITRAKEYLDAGKAGRLDLLSVSPEEFEEFLRWKAQQRPKVRIPALVESFLASKATKGLSGWHTATLTGDLTLFATAFPVYITDLRREEVEAWLDARKVGARRWNNLRASIIALHRFARRDRFLPADLTPVELIEKRKHRPKVETFTPDEFRVLLSFAEPEWLPVLPLGGLCGVRPEEYCPDPRHPKPGLRWEHFQWERRIIDLPQVVSKTGHRRFVPLCDSALFMLAPWRWKKGPVLPPERVSHQTLRWSQASGIRWKQDGLRHSYASYKLAIMPDLQQLSLEMGNSPYIIRRDYLDRKHEEEGVEWFSITPHGWPLELHGTK